jgi:hypothetical protein
VAGSVAHLLLGLATSITAGSGQTLSRPLMPTEPVEIKELMAANLLSQKLEYISKVLALYLGGGGLGCKPVLKHWPKWSGPHLEDAGGNKVDWITVGRFGGDLARGGESEGD